MNTSKLALSMILGASVFQIGVAQDNILSEKPVFTLGEAKTWTSSIDTEYTFITDDLVKLTQNPTNTSNIYLFPEAGGVWNTEANREIGIQGFYVDLEESKAIGTVHTTWEGAAADSYDIYVTDQVPTLDILTTTPSYTVSGLGQYKENTALLPDGTSGRYLVFQPTTPTNWGWGVKICSISATAPQKAILTELSVSPSLVMLNNPTALKIEAISQLGLNIEDAVITVSDNAVLEDGQLTILSDDYATITATYNGVAIDAVVYAATIAPALPTASNITTPIFTNTTTEDNATAGWVTAYNGGATNLGVFNFPNGEVAQGFADARCIFFYNTATTGGWDANVDPDANGWNSLYLDIFATRDVEGSVEFEGTSDTSVVPATNPFTLKAGTWNPIVVKVGGVNRLNNLSVRFSQENASDILLANLYFSKNLPVGVEELSAEATALYTVYNLMGVKILDNVDNDSVKALPADIYIVNGKKVAIR